MDRISLQIRRSPLGGFTGISRYERRMLGGATRLTLENATLDVERINNAIDHSLSKRGLSAAEFRRKFFECASKCVEILRTGEREAREERDSASHDNADDGKRGARVVEQVLHRGGRVLSFALGHWKVPSVSGSQDDSSAGDPDEFDDVPFWPHHRGTHTQDPKAPRAATREAAQRSPHTGA